MSAGGTWYLRIFNERAVLLEIPMLPGVEGETGRVIYEVLAKNAPSSTDVRVVAFLK